MLEVTRIKNNIATENTVFNLKQSLTEMLDILKFKAESDKTTLIYSNLLDINIKSHEKRI